VSTVFISYRRDENAGDARALCNDLSDILGKNSVFMDVDSIALGRDFRDALRERLGSCDLMLVLIGKDWLEARDKAGQRRLDLPDDFVRQEIAAALKRNIPVTPVLLQGAAMPSPEQLPDDLKDLAFRNGFELSYTRWQSDLAEMVKRLDLKADQPPPARPLQVAAAPPPAGTRTRLLAGVGAVVVVGVVALIAVLNWSGHTRDSTVTPPAPNAPAAAGGRPFAVLLSSDTTIGTGGAKDELAKAVEFAAANPPAPPAAMFFRNNYFAVALLFESREAATRALPKIQQFRWKTAYVADLRQWCANGFGTEPRVQEGIPVTTCGT
jgi:hypothetical protein